MTDMNILGFVVFHGEERLLGVHAVLGPCLDDAYRLTVVGVDKDGAIRVVKDYRQNFAFFPMNEVPDWAVVHGRWVDNGIPESMLSKCSVCDYSCGAYSFNYCPNCGAKMDGGAEDG